MAKVKRALKKILEILGCRLVPYKINYPKDLRGIIENPLCAKYHARTSRFLLNVPPEKCMIWWRFSCSKDIGNPLVDTIIDYCENNHATFKDSKMEEYYKFFQPRNVAELFSLNGPLSSELVNFPAYAMVLPWKNTDIHAKKKIVERHVRKENKARGRDLSVKHGIQQFGPVSNEKGELELKTIKKLTKSIKHKGYLRSGEKNNDIISVVLINDDDEYKYIVHSGTHRAAVLSGLGYKKLPIRVEPSVIPAFVYRDEVEYWPQVKKELYTVDQALHIFDTIFEGNGSEIFSAEDEAYLN